MKIDKVKIRNFRGIKKLNINLDETISLIIGRNGSGKTSILDAIAVGLRNIGALWKNENGHYLLSFQNIPNNFFHNKSDNASVEIDFSIGNNFPENYINSILIDGKSSQFMINGTPLYHADYMDNAKKINELFPTRPLFLYYRQDRGFEEKNNNNHQGMDDYSYIINQSLFGDLRAISDLSSWWDKRDAQEARNVRDSRSLSFRDPELEAIRKLVREIDTFKNIYFSSTESPSGLYFQKRDGDLVHVSSLSSGERSYLILLADLARRLQMISPRKDLSDIDGVILIDEIELNLHPAWQSEIISTLLRVFKKCQFVITTHSPQVLSAVESNRVRVLSTNKMNDTIAELPKNTKGRTSNYLLEGVFGAKERFPKADILIDEFNNCIDSMNYEEASLILLQIQEQIEGNPPEILLLKKRLSKLKDNLK